jgi:hypothetical protein
MIEPVGISTFVTSIYILMHTVFCAQSRDGGSLFEMTAEGGVFNCRYPLSARIEYLPEIVNVVR